MCVSKATTNNHLSSGSLCRHYLLITYLEMQVNKSHCMSYTYSYISEEVLTVNKSVSGSKESQPTYNAVNTPH